MGWLIAGLATLILVTGTVWINIHQNAKLRQIAQSRPRVESQDFIAILLQSGVSRKLASATYDAALPYYFGRLTPHPDDSPDDDFLKIDSEDFEDIIAALWATVDLPAPSKDIAVRIPAGLTWSKAAIWIQSQVPSISAKTPSI